MAAETSKTTQVALRIPKDWIPRADRLAVALGRPGMDAGRSDALRAALARGLGILETELGLTPPPSPPPGGSEGKVKARRSRG